MLKLTFRKRKTSTHRILCLGAHSDDIEMGCGGTLLRLLKEYNNLRIYWVIFGADEQRAKEAIRSANHLLTNCKQKNIIIKGFRDSFFPFNGAEIKECFEELKKAFSPDLIFTHYQKDLHQDHRLISDLTWNTFRDHLILEYEVIKYDGDLGTPNLFVHLDEETCHKKIENILSCFKTQRTRDWFTEDAFLAILRLRGIESNAPQKYAEGFYSRKIVF